MCMSTYVEIGLLFLYSNTGTKLGLIKRHFRVRWERLWVRIRAPPEFLLSDPISVPTYLYPPQLHPHSSLPSF